MTADFRWVCLLPDPVTGLDQPITELGSQKPMIWVAPNREMAVRLVKAAIQPAAFNLSSVVSVVDWEARQSSRQRSKLTAEPAMQRGFRNPRQTCWTCGGPTPTPDSAYCNQHRYGRRAKRRSA